MIQIASLGKCIAKGLPDPGILRMCFCQSGKIRKDIVDRSAALDYVTVGVHSQGHITLLHCLPRRSQQGVICLGGRLFSIRI